MLGLGLYILNTELTVKEYVTDNKNSQMHKTQNGIDAPHNIKPLYMQQILFYNNRGRVETADMQEVMFSDGVERFICTHAHVPDAYLPRDVYALTDSEFTAVGTYTISETTSTQWYNARTNVWEGTPSVKTYIFHET